MSQRGLTDRPVGDLAEAFDLVRDETRCRIVLALATRSTRQWQTSGVRFAELRKATDVDDAGRFNYHLRKLEGTLVEHDGDRYHLTFRGYRVAQLIQAGLTGDRSTVDGTTGRCPRCDRSVRTTCEEGFVEVSCPEDGLLFDMYLPPAVVEHHDAETIKTYAGMRAQWYVELAMQGACVECWGPVKRRAPVLLDETAMDPEGTSGDEPTVEFACSGCDTTYWLPPGVCVLRHPAVVAFYYEERDRDVLSGTYYDLDVYDWTYPHVEETARGLAVRFVCDGDLRVELDESATVVEAERGRRDGAGK